MIDVLPPSQQSQVRSQVTATLQAVMTQRRLLPRADGSGRLLVYELMLPNDAIRNMIREARTHQIASVVQTGRAQGMVEMDRRIRDAYDAGEITWDTALAAIGDRRALRR